jgi:hypothetical protein
LKEIWVKEESAMGSVALFLSRAFALAAGR